MYVLVATKKQTAYFEQRQSCKKQRGPVNRYKTTELGKTKKNFHTDNCSLCESGRDRTRICVLIIDSHWSRNIVTRPAKSVQLISK
jgi:hypothetical protein